MNKENIELKKFNKNINVKDVIIGVLILIIIILVIVNRVSHAGFKSSITVPLVKGKISYKHPDFSLVGLYVENDNGDYIESASVPSGSYEINTSKTYCTKPSGDSNINDPKVEITYKNNSLLFDGVTSKNTKCYVYFDIKEEPPTPEQILGKYTIDNSRQGELTGPFTGSTPTTVYSKEDDDGESYVFAGVNPDNWVRIGDIYFRIIRFNGDGSLRLIYSGEGSPATTGAGTYTAGRKFNEVNNNNAHVGLQYTIGQAHGNTENSSMLGAEDSTDLTTLYGWYNSKIKPNYENIIDTNTGFCSDRDPYTDNNGTTSGGGTGTIKTWYGAFIRYTKGSKYQLTYTPTLKCKYTEDKLKIPVGLITADEYMLAGGGVNENGYYNTSVWVHTGVGYWTMTPSDLSINGVNHMFCASSSGYIYNDLTTVLNNYSVRPVINLKANTTFTKGDGTATNPYVVEI